MEVFMVYGA